MGMVSGLDAVRLLARIRRQHEITSRLIDESRQLSDDLQELVDRLTRPSLRAA